MASINPNDSFYSIERKIEEDRKEPKTSKAPPQSSKDFNRLIQEKNKQNSSANFQEGEEFSVVEEEHESFSASQNPQNQGYKPFKLTNEQAKLISSLEISSNEEETSEIQKKLDEAMQLNADLKKRRAVKEELQQANSAIIDKKGAEEKASQSKKASESESVTIDLSAEEMKHLQSLIQKKTSHQKQNSSTKDLLEQLEGALQDSTQASKKSEVANAATSQTGKINKKQLNANKELIETEPDAFPSKSQAKTEVPPSPMQALLESNKSSPIKRQKPIEEKNISQETAQPEVFTKVKEQVSSLENQDPSNSDEFAAQSQEKVIPSDKNTLPLNAKTADSLINQGKKKSESTPTEKVKTEGGGTIPTKETDLKPIENPINSESDKQANQPVVQELPTKDQPPQGTNSVNQVIETAAKNQSIREVANKNVKNPENLIDPSKTQVMAENRAIESLLNERFRGKKEVTPVINQEAKADKSLNTDLKQEASSRAKQPEISSTQTQHTQDSQPIEIKSSRKVKESDVRSIEAEASSASSVAPVLPGIEGSAQLQPDSQQFSKDNMAQLIKELVDQILVIKTQGQTDTIVTLRSPKVLEGATIKISTYDQARGEVNITFANLTPEAKKILDSSLARESLADNLKDKSDIIVHNIVTTTQAETPYILPQKQVRDEQEKEGRQRDDQQQEDQRKE